MQPTPKSAAASERTKGSEPKEAHAMNILPQNGHNAKDAAKTALQVLAVTKHTPRRIDDQDKAERQTLRGMMGDDGDMLDHALRYLNAHNWQNIEYRAIAEALWTCHYRFSKSDAETIEAFLLDQHETEAAVALNVLILPTPAPSRDEFHDAAHTVQNWKLVASTCMADFETFTFADMAALPRPQWLIRSLLVEKTTSVISADSGHFKSFIALEMALCVATGTPFHGREVRQGAAVYVAAEGFYTVYERAAAWAQERGCELPENFHILKVPVNVSEAATVQSFAQTVAAFSPALVVLDTLSQCAIGLNENANNEMAGFMGGMMALSHQIGAHVQTVHHNSKATGTFRGAGAIKANVDTHITLDRPDAENTVVFVRCEKQRGRPFDAFALAGAEIELPFTDEYGDAVTSLVFDECGESVTAKHPNAKKADKTGTALLEVFDKVATEAAALGIDGVKVGFWKEAATETETPVCSERAFWRHRKALESSGAIIKCGTHSGSPIYRKCDKELSKVPQLPQLPNGSDGTTPKSAAQGTATTAISFRNGSTGSTGSDRPQNEVTLPKTTRNNSNAQSEAYTLGPSPELQAQRDLILAANPPAQCGGCQKPLTVAEAASVTWSGDTPRIDCARCDALLSDGPMPDESSGVEYDL